MNYLNTPTPSVKRTLTILGFAVLLIIGYVIAKSLRDSTNNVSSDNAAVTWPISCFVYRDDNRNGLFDLADRPYAGLRVEIERPDGSVARNRSNVAGFANFKLAKGVMGDTNLHELGSYKVSALPPEGWEVTSSMEPNQELVTSARSNVGGGMIIDPPCTHIGVGADISLSGMVSSAGGLDDKNLVLEASVAGGEVLALSLDEDGRYQFSATPGKWTIDIQNKESGESVSRAIEIGATSAVVSEISFGAKPLEKRDGVIETITFAELTSSETLYEIPSGYHGLHWQYWVATHIKFYNGYGYVNGAMSDEYMAYNSSGFPASFSSDEPFDFIGAYVTAAWPKAEEDFVTVKAWRDGEVQHEDQISITPAGPVYFAADYLNVEKVEFVMGNRERIIIDDVLIRR